MSVPILQDLQVSTANVKRLQHESPDLEKYFSLADSQEIIRSGKLATVRYEKRNGVLNRVYQLPGRSDIKQLMVPEQLRKAVLGLAHDSVMSGH